MLISSESDFEHLSNWIMYNLLKPIQTIHSLDQDKRWVLSYQRLNSYFLQGQQLLWNIFSLRTTTLVRNYITICINSINMIISKRTTLVWQDNYIEGQFLRNYFSTKSIDSSCKRHQICDKWQFHKGQQLLWEKISWRTTNVMTEEYSLISLLFTNGCILSGWPLKFWLSENIWKTK